MSTRGAGGSLGWAPGEVWQDGTGGRAGRREEGGVGSLAEGLAEAQGKVCAQP